jgi:hypothetical protein
LRRRIGRRGTEGEWASPHGTRRVPGGGPDRDMQVVPADGDVWFGGPGVGFRIGVPECSLMACSSAPAGGVRGKRTLCKVFCHTPCEDELCRV